MNRRVREAVVRIAKIGERDGHALPVLETTLKPLLSSASVLYRGLSLMRRLLYGFRLITPTRLPVPVVSVGNITWGGNGKTPMVETISRWFLGAGICPLILTRGYAGGDEAQMLQMHLQGTCAKLGVGSNRADIAHKILRRHGITSHQRMRKLAESLNLEFGDTSAEINRNGDGSIGVVIIDDGMQHLPLARDLEIVMVNLISLWGNQRIVPRGPLREPLQELKRADVVVLHHADLVSEARVQKTKDGITQYLREDSVVICSSMTPQYLYRLPVPETKAGLLPRIQEHTRLPLETLTNAVVLSVSGVGCPEAVSLVLEKLRVLHVERMDYVDHHSFDAKDIEDIERRCLTLQNRFPGMTPLVVLTEKDYVREPFIWSRISSAKVIVLHSCLDVISSRSSLLDLRRLLIRVASSSVTDEKQSRSTVS